MVLRILFLAMMATGLVSCVSRPKVTEPGDQGYGPQAMGVTEEKNFFGYKIQQVTKPNGTDEEIIWY